MSISIGELIDPPGNDLSELLLDIFHQVRHIWPAFFILTIAGIISFFDRAAKDRKSSLQTTLFYKTSLVTVIIAGSLLLVFTFGIKSKLAIVMITILARLGLKYYLNPEAFKPYLEKTGIRIKK